MKEECRICKNANKFGCQIDSNTQEVTCFDKPWPTFMLVIVISTVFASSLILFVIIRVCYKKSLREKTEKILKDVDYKLEDLIHGPTVVPGSVLKLDEFSIPSRIFRHPDPQSYLYSISIPFHRMQCI